MTPAIRMPVPCLNVCWLTPEARGARACIDLQSQNSRKNPVFRCPPLWGDGYFEATGGEELDVRIARAQLLQQLDIDTDKILNRHSQAARGSHQWQRRTNVWREVTSPAHALRSI